MIVYGSNIQCCPCPCLWCEGGTCSESDIDLTATLLSWWELTDGISALSDTDQGIYGNALSHAGASPSYVNDTDRGDLTGAANFGSAVFFVLTDGVGDYIDSEPTTWGIAVKLDDLLQDGTILYYGDASFGYEIRYDYALNRFLWIVGGNSGTVTVVGNEGGDVVAGEWYWIEAAYSGGTASVRVARNRTDEGFPMEIEADTGTVPGGILETPGNLVIGFGTSVLHGRLAAVGYWGKTLNDCERGRVNNPTDYPFSAAVAAGFESEGGDSFAAEDGSTTFVPE